MQAAGQDAQLGAGCSNPRLGYPKHFMDPPCGKTDMSLKARALLVLCSTIAGGLIAIAGASLGLYSAPVGVAAALVCMCLGFAAAGRLKCDRCGVVLAKNVPAGALILLFFAKDKCRSCGTSLP
jgi:hypothetical protein